MSDDASRSSYFDAAGTYTLRGVSRLVGVLVGTGASSATVTIRYADTDDEIAVIDAANPDALRRIPRKLDPAEDIEVVVAQAPKVTVFYD